MNHQPPETGLLSIVGPDPEIQFITVQLGGLDFTGVAPQAAVVSGGPEPPEFENPHNIFLELEELVLGSDWPEQFALFPLHFLSAYIEKLLGEIVAISSPSLPRRNSIYIVLRGPENSPGFWTGSYQTDLAGVGVAGGSLHHDSISHGFPARVEAACYLCGAQQRWPPQA